MISISTRSMTDRERDLFENTIADIESRADLPQKVISALLAVAISTGCAAAAYLPFHLGWDWLVTLMFAMPLGFAANMGLYRVFVLVEDYREAAKQLQMLVPQYRSILEDDRVEITRVTTDRHIEIEPIDGHFMSYLFDVGDGQILILKNQNSQIIEDDADWPSTEFDVIRTSKDHVFLGISARGEELMPIRVILSEECDPRFFESDHPPIVTADLEEFADSLVRRQETA